MILRLGPAVRWRNTRLTGGEIHPVPRIEVWEAAEFVRREVAR